MKKPTTITPESVSEYREFVELCLRKRVLEAIERDKSNSVRADD